MEENKYIKNINKIVKNIDCVIVEPITETEKDITKGIIIHNIIYPTSIQLHENSLDEELDVLNEKYDKYISLIEQSIEKENVEVEMINFGVNSKGEVLLEIILIEDIENFEPVLSKYFKNNIGKDVKVSLDSNNKCKQIFTIRIINVVENWLICDYLVETTVPSGFIDGSKNTQWKANKINLKYLTSVLDVAQELNK